MTDLTLCQVYNISGLAIDTTLTMISLPFTFNDWPISSRSGHGLHLGFPQRCEGNDLTVSHRPRFCTTLLQIDVPLLADTRSFVSHPTNLDMSGSILCNSFSVVPFL